MSYQKEKGKLLENHVVAKLAEYGLDIEAQRDGASGASNRDKRDIQTKAEINGRTIGIECKNHARPAIRDWWDQTCKLQTLGYEPVLVYKLFGESLGESKVVIYLDTFLELLAQSKGEITVSQEADPKFKWKMAKLKQAVQEIFKDL